MENNIVFSVIAIFYTFIFGYSIYNFKNFKNNKIILNIFYVVLFTLSVSMLIIMCLYVSVFKFSNYILIFNITFWPLIVILYLFFTFWTIKNKKEHKKIKYSFVYDLVHLVINLLILAGIIYIFVFVCLDKNYESVFPMNIRNIYSFEKSKIYIIFIMIILGYCVNLVILLFCSFMYKNNSEILEILVNVIGLGVIVVVFITFKNYNKMLNNNESPAGNFLLEQLYGWLKVDYTNYMASAIILQMTIQFILILSSPIDLIKIKKKEKVRKNA